MPKPLKVKQGNPNRVCEFEAGDVLEVEHGGTNATNPADALTNLGGVSINAFGDHLNDTTNPHFVTAAQVGAIPSTAIGQASGVCPLDSGGKVPAANIPAIALPQVYVVPDIPARDALTVQEGDEAVTTDSGDHWIYDGTSWIKRPTSNIIQLKNVNGRTLPCYFDTQINKWLTVESKTFTYGENAVNNNDFIQIGQVSASNAGYTVSAGTVITEVRATFNRTYGDDSTFGLWDRVQPTRLGDAFTLDPTDDQKAYYYTTPYVEVVSESILAIKREGAGPALRNCVIAIVIKETGV